MSPSPRQLAHDLRRRALKIRPVNETPYATHLPVLAALARVFTVRRVLELGSGPFSTALYLNREVFPDLELLVSYEDDSQWKQVVLDAVGEDERLDLRMVDSVRDSVPDNLDDFDLTFIDDSRTAAERSITIERVREKAPPGVVVIHDFEQRRYRNAARGYANRFIFSTFTPQVGVCWNGDPALRERLQVARTLIESESSTAVTDVRAWTAVGQRLA